MIIHANVQSIHNKYLEIEHVICDENCDVVCLTETWAKDCHIEAMNFDNYELATYYNRQIFEHGGTAIFVKNNLEYKVRKDLNKLSFEMNCELAAIELRGSKIVIVSVYRPDKDMNLFFDILTRLLHNICREGKQLVIAGDFNINVLKPDKKTKKLCEILLNFKCYWLLNSATRTSGSSSTCLDNFIVNFDQCKGYVLDTKLSDHNVIKLVIENSGNEIPKLDSLYKRIMSKNNCNYFHYLLRIEYNALKSQIINCNDPNEQMSILLEAIKHYYNVAFPKVKCQTRKHYKKWTTKGIETSKNNLAKLEILQDYQPNEQRKIRIKKYKNVLRKAMQSAKKMQYAFRIKSSSNKIKETWKIVGEQVRKRNNQGSKSSINCVKNSANAYVKDAKVMADVFNDFFRNIAHRLTSNVNINATECMHYLGNIVKPQVCIKFEPIDFKELRNIIIHIKSKLTNDIYDMNTKTIRELMLQNNYLMELLLSVINGCIKNGIFPNVLKIGKVIPLYKKGETCDLSNYRPICILPTLSKVLETVIKNRIVKYFEQNDFFSAAQFGFRRSRSTEMAIRKVVYFILNALDESKKCASIYCDLSKAFDCLRHDILLFKLKYYGFDDVEYNMMQSYLDNRSQVVTVNNINSERGKVDIGVPQGSILGPVLFLIYINDLAKCLPEWTFVNLFADDTHVGMKDKSKSTLENKLTMTMSILKKWFEANGIILNADKSIIMHYQTRKGVEPNVLVKDNVFLGYTIDHTISHLGHIDKLCKKLSSANYALFKLKPLIDKKALITVYYAYVHSLINYAVTVWGNAADINRVLVCQKRSIRVINGLHKRMSAKLHFKQNKIMTVISLYIYNSLLEIHTDKNNLDRNKDTHNYNLRNNEKLRQPKTRLAKVQKQGIYNKIMMYNKLPNSVTKLNMPNFKRKLKYFFVLNPFYSLNEFMSLRLTESSFIYNDYNE